MDCYPSSPPVLAQDATDVELELDLVIHQKPARAKRYRQLQSDHNAAPADFPGGDRPVQMQEDTERQQRATTSSSSPPTFSSDGPLDDEDAFNYSSYNSWQRMKRKYTGAWYDNTEFGGGEGPRMRTAKKSKITRNFDSGVFMASDDSSFMDAEIPAGPKHDSKPNSSSQEPKHEVDPRKRRFYEILNDLQINNRSLFPAVDLAGLNLTETDLPHMSTVCSALICLPLDPGSVSFDAAYYRSFIPNLYIDLSHNELKHIPPCVWEIESLQSLILHCNQLEDLHFPAAKLKHLKLLDLRNNKLTALPYELIQPCIWGKIRVNTYGNPFAEWDKSWKRYGGHDRPIYYSPITYFDDLGKPLAAPPNPPPTDSQTARSLFSLSMSQCIKEASVPEIKRLLNDDIPPAVDTVLTIAERNHHMTGRSLKTCRCGREYVIVMAEWTEWWCCFHDQGTPFKAQACSWACVPEL